MQSTRTRRNQRSSDFLENVLRRSYFGAAAVAALGMLLLPFLPIPHETRLLLWLSLTGSSFAVAFVLLIYWRNGDADREAQLMKALWEVGNRRGSPAGLRVRDPLTGLYTPEYWLHALELRNGHHLRRATPVTCLMIGMNGLPQIRQEYGDPVADHLLRNVALQILADVRPSDAVCSYREGRFAIALLRCPADRAASIADRLTSHLRPLLQSQNGALRDQHLQVLWQTATLPGDVFTPVQLLRVAGQLLDVQLSLAGHSRD